MPKHDFLSAKAIGNRQKSIGLQRLRWYCQMCLKQCRDENGFKCHTQSEGHLRQMRVFAENSGSILSNFSAEFERGYLETLSHLHGTKRVKANKVYQEYIADKNHIHMNATSWSTLTGFCMYLGREGKAIVDETEKGWFIQYIDRDPKVLARQALKEQRQRFELDEEERKKREIAAQIAAAEDRLRVNGNDEYTDNKASDDDNNALLRDESEQKISVPLKSSILLCGVGRKRPRQLAGFVENDDDEDNDDSANVDAANSSIPSSSSSSTAQHHHQGYRGGTLAVLIKEEELRRQKQLQLRGKMHEETGEKGLKIVNSVKDGKDCNNNDIINDKYNQNNNTSNVKNKSWLHFGIVVKVISKKVHGGRLYKQKGTVIRLLNDIGNNSEAEVSIMMKTGGNSSGEKEEVVRLYQDEVETVVPKVGQLLLIVQGQYRGCEGVLLAIHEDKFNCDIRITKTAADADAPLLARTGEGNHNLNNRNSAGSSSSDKSLVGKELYCVEYEDICKYDPPSAPFKSIM